MTDDLFGERVAETTQHDPAPPWLADWLVAQVRRALDGTGATDVAARQRIVESLVDRPEWSPAEWCTTT